MRIESKSRVWTARENQRHRIRICQPHFPDLELSKLIHPVLTVPESIPVKALLKKMQQERAHIAVLVDEYGGTSGMITIEDILEEIVGEIRDEFDDEEHHEIEKLSEHRFIVDGKVSLSHINDLLNRISRAKAWIRSAGGYTGRTRN